MIIISKTVEERGDEKENIMNPQKSGKEERETFKKMTEFKFECIHNHINVIFFF